MTSKAKTNPFTFRVTWKPFTQQDITWVQRFISLLPNNPELRFFKRAASRVHITNSGEARYVDSLNEFIYEEDDVLVLGDYTITKSIARIACSCLTANSASLIRISASCCWAFMLISMPLRVNSASND